MGTAKKTIISLLILTYLAMPYPAWAVAYCALRDPITSIYDLFPNAEGYRSSVKTVGREARDAVKTKLPFSLHFNELGRHTLYVVLKNRKSIGFVHARSELGEWGVTEYAWAISTEGKILDVRVQRSRDPEIKKRDPIELSSFVSNMGLKELQQAYASTTNSATQQSLLSSAMKTLVITNTVWANELVASEPLSIAKDHNSEAHAVIPIVQLYDSAAQRNLDNMGMTESPAFLRHKNTGYRVDNRNGDMIALLIRTPFDMDTPDRFLWWYVSNDGEITGVLDERTMLPDEAFSGVIGYAPNSIHNCSTLTDLAALEIATLSRSHVKG